MGYSFGRAHLGSRLACLPGEGGQDAKVSNTLVSVLSENPGEPGRTSRTNYLASEMETVEGADLLFRRKLVRSVNPLF
jgi:hypothetical protein